MAPGGPEPADAVQRAKGVGSTPPSRWPTRFPTRWPLLLFGAFAAVAICLYRSALTGPFISDDFGYLVSHPYTAPLTLGNILAILDPTGPAKLYAANYAPVHLLLTAVERHMFADALPGYHLVNVAVHALCGVLVVAWLRTARLPDPVALVGGILFLVHPANVEVVAWSSQLKTCGSLAFALGALLAFRRAPASATALFALSLLTKASGLFALPTLAAAVWARRGDRSEWTWLAVWLGIAVLYAIPQYGAFAHLGAVEVEAYRDPLVQLRTVAAVGMRYLVMAATSWGVSAFQEPEPVTSWLDPWWLTALGAGALLGWRLYATLRDRSVEAVFWVAAAASFAPVSQVFPFLNPVADRYLYFILPGLLGGTLSRPLWSRSLGGGADRRGAAIALVAVAAVSLGFAARSAERAELWRNETLLLLDAASHYPEGGTAHFLRARAAAREGDTVAAVNALRFASERGIDSFQALRRDPGLAVLHGRPEFESLVDEVAGRWIERAQRRGYATQPELRMLALAHVERDEPALALAAYDAALRVPGPLEPILRAERNALAARQPGVAEPDAEPESGGGATHRAQDL